MLTGYMLSFHSIRRSKITNYRDDDDVGHTNEWVFVLIILFQNVYIIYFLLLLKYAWLYCNVNIPATSVKNKWNVLPVYFKGPLSAQLEQPIRVLLARACQSPNPSSVVPVQRPANLEVCRCGCVSWSFLLLLCFFIMCTLVWNLQKRRPLKPLSRGAAARYFICSSAPIKTQHYLVHCFYLMFFLMNSEVLNLKLSILKQ